MRLSPSPLVLVLFALLLVPTGCEDPVIGEEADAALTCPEGAHPCDLGECDRLIAVNGCCWDG